MCNIQHLLSDEYYKGEKEVDLFTGIVHSLHDILQGANDPPKFLPNCRPCVKKKTIFALKSKYKQFHSM